MWDASANLRSLEDQLDDHVHILRYAPFKHVTFEPQYEDPQCLSLKIFLGCMAAKRFGEDEAVLPVDADDLQKVWIHLNASNKGEGVVEVQFHVYELGGEYSSKLDADSTARIISKFAPAFALPSSGRMTRAKIVALAKYFYLRRQYEKESKTDAEVLRCGMTISKAFRTDLINVCRDFGKETREPDAAVPRGVAVKELSSQEDASSVAPQAPLNDDDTALGNIIIAGDGIKKPTEPKQNVRTTVSLWLPLQVKRCWLYQKTSSPAVIKKKLIELDEQEKATEDAINVIESKLATLEEKRVAKKLEQSGLKKRRSDIFQGMSAEAAFRLGRQMEREETPKRVRRECWWIRRAAALE
jgi:hypothetical protein